MIHRQLILIIMAILVVRKVVVLAANTHYPNQEQLRNVIFLKQPARGGQPENIVPP
jgi:hypothetical protein